MKFYSPILIALILFSCSTNQVEETTEIHSELSTVHQMSLTKQEAERLLKLPLGCIDLEYPNKLNQVIGADSDLQSPEELHPAFYGCFDWHSSVHGHWSLVKILKSFPEIDKSDSIIAGLKNHLTPENINGEIEYFSNPLSQGFERMYGWAWLLKLADELKSWDHPEASILSKNLQPLTDVIVERTIEFLPKLNYPIRVGTHTNTAFALSLMYDYAITAKNQELKNTIEEVAKKFYQIDADCPLEWEPSGYDFLSPCLEEANLMSKILSDDEFEKWIEQFLPDLLKADFKLKPGIVSDRTDGHLVHLDGLNFSRAWCLNGISRKLPSKTKHLTVVANDHINHSLPSIVDDNYEGGHWLASFALMALSN